MEQQKTFSQAEAWTEAAIKDQFGGKECAERFDYSVFNFSTIDV